MSLLPCPPLPFDTAREADLVFGRQHPYLKIGQSLGSLWEELDLSEQKFSDPFVLKSFYPYSLVTIVQYWEMLTDRQMSQATRTRLDMKFALHFPLNYPGVEPYSLCEFRQHLLGDWKAKEVTQGLMDSLNSFTDREKSSISVNKMVTAICLPNRAESIFECMALALEAIAAKDASWLKAHTLPHWYGRYHLNIHHHVISTDPKELKALIRSVGKDGQHLLAMIDKTNPLGLSQLSEIGKLRKEWHYQFHVEGDSLKFRDSHCLTCNRELRSTNTISRRKEEEGSLINGKI